MNLLRYICEMIGIEVDEDNPILVDLSKSLVYTQHYKSTLPKCWHRGYNEQGKFIRMVVRSLPP
jgi:hypothetical protein